MIQTQKTLSEIMEILRKRGYTEDFNLIEQNISYKANNEPVDIHNLVIDKIYRFTGGNNPDDEAILYAMHNKADGVKGVFVNGYGIYTDDEASKIIDNISLADDHHLDWNE